MYHVYDMRKANVRNEISIIKIENCLWTLMRPQDNQETC